MKLLLLLSALVALLTGVRVLCQDPEPKEDADYWTSTNHQVRSADCNWKGKDTSSTD